MASFGGPTLACLPSWCPARLPPPAPPPLGTNRQHPQHRSLILSNFSVQSISVKSRRSSVDRSCSSCLLSESSSAVTHGRKQTRHVAESRNSFPVIYYSLVPLLYTAINVADSCSLLHAGRSLLLVLTITINLSASGTAV